MDSFLQAFQGPDDCLEMRERMESFDERDVSYKLGNCLIPVRCTAPTVLGSPALSCNMILIQILTSTLPPPIATV